MPELPEVEVCRRDLERWTRGRRVVRFTVTDPGAVRSKLSTTPGDALRGGPARLRRLEGAVSERILRHGKRIGWLFAGREEALLVHLGMTGQWVRRADEPPGPHVRLVVEVEDGARLWFEDARRFGCVTPVRAEEVEERLAEGHGPDALLAPPSAEELRRRLKGRRPVKVALMDQAVLAGVGNIHASEACWRAHIHPETPAGALSDEQIARLAAVLPEQLAEFVAQMDGHEHAYVTQGGDNPFSIYDRAGEPCPRCGGPVAHGVHGGRSTYWCPACQPGGAPEGAG
jgi:formamidopyrimidine-DNA glycosylase